MLKIIFCVLWPLILSAVVPSSDFLQEIYVEANDEMKLDGKLLNYQVISGTLVLKDKDNKDRASIGYTAYFLKGVESNKRPIAFCFNGGPGSAAVWLNTGFMGPKRTEGEDIFFQDPPYNLINNESSLLDKIDMVFIDPVSTGFSQLANGANYADIHGVDEDVEATVDFIRLFTARYLRYDSPKYMISESYGGLRTAKAAYRLHDEFGYYLNGLLFISPALDMQTITAGECNDLPYLLFLPSMTAVAHYHKKISGDLSNLLKESESFSTNAYAHALFLGNKISHDQKKYTAEKLSQLTGLSFEKIMKMNLRISSHQFLKELLQNEGILGRFDGRIIGIDSNENSPYAHYDPSIDAIFGAISATFNQYLLKVLKLPHVGEYRVLVPLINWNWGKGNQYVSALKELRQLMAQNPKLKVVFMSGIYDLAIPYHATEFVISRLGQNSNSQISHFLYPAGHMMYYNSTIRKLMKSNLNEFFK